MCQGARSSNIFPRVLLNHQLFAQNLDDYCIISIRLAANNIKVRYFSCGELSPQIVS